MKAWRKEPDVEFDPYDEDHIAEMRTQTDRVDL
jgi:hypothetical protein